MIGWSGGGPHALACAALMADRVQAVATIASVAPYPADGLDYLAGMGKENVEEFTAALTSDAALIEFKEQGRRAARGDRAGGRDVVGRPHRRRGPRLPDRRVRRVPRGVLPRGAPRVVLGLVRR